jgi:hypothetical protein
MREVALAQKVLRAALQRFAKRSVHEATFRCVGAVLGASGLLSFGFRAAFSAPGVAVLYTRAYPRRCTELSRAHKLSPLSPPVAHLGAGGRVLSRGR